MTVLTPVIGTRLAPTRTGSPVQVRLPAGGWQVGFRAQLHGHTVVEVTDPAGTLVSWIAGDRPTVSIDAGWVGCAHGPSASLQWWVLAIGHAPTAAERPTVIFSQRPGRRAGRGRSTRPPRTVDGLWIAHDGLWIAAATGRYTHVRLIARATTRVRRLRLIKDPAAVPGSLRAG